jgi:hypothetical protein
VSTIKGSRFPALSSFIASTINGWRGRASSKVAKTFSASAVLPWRARKLPYASATRSAVGSSL